MTAEFLESDTRPDRRSISPGEDSPLKIHVYCLFYRMEKLEYGDVVPLYDLLEKCSRLADKFVRDQAARLKSQVTVFRHTTFPEARSEAWKWVEWTYRDLRNFVETPPPVENRGCFSELLRNGQ